VWQSLVLVDTNRDNPDGESGSASSTDDRSIAPFESGRVLDRNGCKVASGSEAEHGAEERELGLRDRHDRFRTTKSVPLSGDRHVRDRDASFPQRGDEHFGLGWWTTKSSRPWKKMTGQRISPACVSGERSS